MTEPSTQWNPDLYQSSHAFVWELGRGLLPLLAAAGGERILDLGCGTGQLTAEVGNSGAVAQGIDKALSMVEQARRNFPGIRFDAADVTALPFSNGEFDAVFSNAVLHWVPDARRAAAEISRVLKPGGRFIAEFGGRGNTATLLEAVYEALKSLGIHDPERLCPWYYPGIAEYAGVLEEQGLEVTFAALFERPTPLEGGEQGLRNWLNMFGGAFSGALRPEQHEEFIARVEALASGRLFRHGTWTVDYRRLRVLAVKPGE